MKNRTDHGVVFRAANTSWASLTWAPSAVSNQRKAFLYFANGAGGIGLTASSVPNWTRIFDFGNYTTSYMFLTPQNGSTSRLHLASRQAVPGGEQQINGTSALAAGPWYHVAVTLNGNRGILYLNGSSVGINKVMKPTPSSFGSTADNYLGRPQFSADAYLNAALDEFRIDSVALSVPEIAATYALGPSEGLSSNLTTAVTAAPASLILNWPLVSAGFITQSRTNLALGDWVNVTSPVPQIIGGQCQVTIPLSAGGTTTFFPLLMIPFKPNHLTIKL